MIQAGGTGTLFAQNPYIVAELNTSHFGNKEIARDMIASCKDIGADCVKFQSWSEESLYADAYFKQNPIAKRFFKKYSMAPEDLKDLAQFGKSIGIGFSSTPYSQQEADFLVGECGAAFIKIASMDLNNLSYLDYIARMHVPTVLSTGMGTLPEIERAVAVFDKAGHQQLSVLHCVSLYPCPPQACNLNNIVLLKETFPHVAVGYSDHTKGPEAAVAAVALGAQVIEKHFTLDSSKIGMDNHMATEPDDFAGMVKLCRSAAAALGRRERHLSDAEEEQRLAMRRSAVAVRDIAEGEVLRASDIVFKRPGTGIAPDVIDAYWGRKLKRTVAKGDVLNTDDLQE